MGNFADQLWGISLIGVTGTTREFLAMCSIAARFGRPGTPTDQAWIETLFGHVKTEWPHLEKITDPNTLRAELDIARHDYNTRRLHASLGYVTPDDEHQGRGQRIRQARQDGLNRARLTRIAYPSQQQTQPAMNTPAQCGAIKPPKTDIYSEAPPYSVDADGTEPNRAPSQRRTSMSLHASPPPANTNNACTSALPRSPTGSRSPIGP